MSDIVKLKALQSDAPTGNNQTEAGEVKDMKIRTIVSTSDN